MGRRRCGAAARRDTGGTRCCSSAASPGTSLDRAEDALDVHHRSCCRGSGTRPASRSARSPTRRPGGLSYVETEWEDGAGRASAALLDAALDAIRDLPATPGRAGARPPGPPRRERARGASASRGSSIDPKPLVGEREFSVAPIVRVAELGHNEARRAAPLRPAHRRARARPRARARLDDRADGRVVGAATTHAHVGRSRAGCWRLRDAARGPLRRRLHARRPGPELGPRATAGSGERFGLELDPARYDEARDAAIATLQRHPELDHDEEVWVALHRADHQRHGRRPARRRECARR